MRTWSGNARRAVLTKGLRRLLSGALLLGLLLAAFAAPLSAAAAPPDPPPPPPSRGPAGQANQLAQLSFRPGDSPVDASGVPEWTKSADMQGWLSGDPDTVRAHLDERTDYYWVRAELPYTGSSDMFIMLDRVSSEIRYDAYVGGRLVYSQERLGFSADKLASVSPTFVPLGRPGANDRLYLRIWTGSSGQMNFKQIGPILYGPEVELKLGLIRSGLPTVLVLIVFFVLGLVSLLIYFINRENETDLYFSLFSLFISFNLLFSIRALALFLPFSELDRAFRAPLIGGMGYCFCLYFAGIFRMRFDAMIRHLAKIILLVGLIVPFAQWAYPAFFNENDGFLNSLNKLGYYTGCLLCLLLVVPAAAGVLLPHEASERSQMVCRRLFGVPCRATGWRAAGDVCRLACVVVSVRAACVCAVFEQKHAVFDLFQHDFFCRHFDQTLCARVPGDAGIQPAVGAHQRRAAADG